ncbi:hypothetical protein CB0940_09194 [Cercospora beticola]|uniref:Uncharacterized protein n=1 Tax=Cercospora beticola TaxID=122368 RepID=A0A2G5HGS8_CERBT|nr:hypothetical protein CB0940_09194 [Cercospora beticola]PIA91796.1 hypothetical protein CB0940_09194 [Cercospora beticola]WPB06511.1 hypothetical protein RHO25_011168 [Cercospora beticola]
MPSYTAVAAILVGLYFSKYLYNFIRNTIYARKSGLPYFFVPWDQNSFFWMVASVPLQPYLSKLLPSWIWKRLALTIYSFEFQEKLEPYERFAKPQGNELSYVMVTPGLYEISTRDPEVAYEVLRRPRDFVQHHLTSMFMSRFGGNLLTADGDDWHRQRRVVAGTITERISKAVWQESVVQTESMIEEVFGGTGESTVGKKAETKRMFDYMKKITINVLSGVGMGESIDWKNDKNAKPEPGHRMTYIQAVNAIINAVAGPIILPSWFLDNYPSFLPGHKFLRDVGQAVKEFPSYNKSLLEREKAQNAEAGQSRNNIMSQLLKASESETKNGARVLTEEEMSGNLFVFTAAGFDTTANTLSYALVLLCCHPEWQDWMFEELDSILPSADSTEELDYTSIFPKATRTLAIMFETLRIFSPLVHMAKQTVTEQTITTSRGTFWFPPNATVYVNNIGLHLAPDVWRNLNVHEEWNEHEDRRDEEHFRPSRWLNTNIAPLSDSNSQPTFFQPPKGTFSPWSLGPRVCPGQKMAQVEFVSIFVTLFRRYRVEAVPEKKSDSGEWESKEEVRVRLERKMKDSESILTLQMRGIYGVKDENGKEGLALRLVRRR